jgi:hypothetical protein
MKTLFRKTTAALLLLVMLCPATTRAGADRSLPAKADPHAIDWQTFLLQHDLVWDSIPRNYYAGAIMGNGLLGANLYGAGDGSDKPGAGTLRFHVGRVDITEGQMPEPKTDYRNLFHGARLPVGYFLLHTAGTLQSTAMRLNLWNAETTACLDTDAGKLFLRSYVHATQPVIVLEADAAGGERQWTWTWTPLRAISPRVIAGRDDYPQDYIDHPNPDVKTYTDGGTGISVQNLRCGKTYVVAWKEERKGDGHTRILITIAQEESEAAATAQARKTLATAASTPGGTLEAGHRAWWHAYYPASFASFGDARLESFYWIQQYKLACLTRPDGHVIDLQGPWAVESTPWPAIWMNLNTQLTYSPLATANRCDLSRPLWTALWDNRQNLIDNVPEPWRTDASALGRSTSYHFYSRVNPDVENKLLYETGNLTWLLYYWHEHCLYTGDEETLTTRLFHLLKRSIAYYAHIRERGDDGLWHLPPTASPEYTSAPDCNYDLALLRWGLGTLLRLNRQYGLNDPSADDWQEFLDCLTSYPASAEEGFLIGRDVRLTGSHRHYSHLLMIYPLRLITWDEPAYRDLIARSIAHWQSMPQWLQGYSFTGSASMYAMQGDGDRALSQLQKLMAKYIQPNTLYRESGPVIETPLAAAATLQELYLQSWDGTVRVFPAVPAAWPEASFIRFRAEGAFLVSARRRGGRTVYIQVESERGGLCRLQTGMDADNLKVEDAGGKSIAFSVVDKARGLIELNTRKGDVMRITGGTRGTVMPEPVKHPEKEWNPYAIRSETK